MKRTEEFINDGDRYQYDWGLCSTGNGFAQFDTQSDAWYYGAWVNPEKLLVFSYAEGDCVTEEYDDAAEFVAGVRAMAQWHGPEFIGIDPGFSDELKGRFVALGLDDLFN